MPFSVVPSDNLSESDRVLLSAAQEARSKAYAPYSKYSVGAAVRALDGSLYSAANIENASYGLSLCAEICALAVANADGNFRIEAIALTGGKINAQLDGETARHVTPCGRCRQVILEAAHVSETDIKIICGIENHDDVLVGMISDFLPAAFGPDDLGSNESSSLPDIPVREATG